MASSSSPMAVVLAVLVMAAALFTAQAQQPASCAATLVPCANYLNFTTTPPNSCCDPIKEAVKNDLPCLCNLYKNPAIFTQFRINITEALRLPSLCGIPNDVSACNGPLCCWFGASSADAPGGSKSPPGSSSNPGSAGSDNGVGKISSSGIVGLFLSSVCFMLF